MDTARELDRLCEIGVPFSIALAEQGGFVVRLGYYVRGPAPTTQADTMEDAVNWIRAQVALKRRH